MLCLTCSTHGTGESTANLHTQACFAALERTYETKHWSSQYRCFSNRALCFTSEFLQCVFNYNIYLTKFSLNLSLTSTSANQGRNDNEEENEKGLKFHNCAVLLQVHIAVCAFKCFRHHSTPITCKVRVPVTGLFRTNQ